MAGIKTLLGLIGLGIFSLSSANAENISAQSAERRIIVFPPGTPKAKRLAIAKETDARVVRELDLIDAVVIEAPSDRIQAASALIESDPGVLRVDADPLLNWLKAADVYPRLPGLVHFLKPSPGESVRVPAVQGVLAPGAVPEPPPLPWGIRRVNAPAAWKKTQGAGVKVVVIDTGIDYNHPDLKPILKGGWSMLSRTTDYMDDHGHGTHCSGTIAGQGQVIDGSAIWGVSPKVDLYGVKVLDKNGSGTFDDVIAGMQWAVDNHMDVASMSLGASSPNDSLKAAVDAMVKGGVALIAAAGNSYHDGDGDTVVYPGAYPGAVAIAASDSADAVADFSSAGDAVALIGPGADVLSLAPGGGTAVMSGTSMATPHNAGLAALAVASGAHGYQAVRAALIAAAGLLKDPAGKPWPARLQGAGLVDAATLVK